MYVSFAHNLSSWTGAHLSSFAHAIASQVWGDWANVALGITSDYCNCGIAPPYTHKNDSSLPCNCQGTTFPNHMGGAWTSSFYHEARRSSESDVHPRESARAQRVALQPMSPRSRGAQPHSGARCARSTSSHPK